MAPIQKESNCISLSKNHGEAEANLEIFNFGKKWFGCERMLGNFLSSSIRIEKQILMEALLDYYLLRGYKL